MNAFEFTDESHEDRDGWWDEVYSSKCGNYYHYALVNVLDACVSTQDKLKIAQLPEYGEHWIRDDELILSDIDDLDIKSLESIIKGMGYDITIDGICIFKYDTRHQGYMRSVDGKYCTLPTLVNKYMSDDAFISKLGELLTDCGISGDTMSGFLNLVYIREKALDASRFLGCVDDSNRK